MKLMISRISCLLLITALHCGPTWAQERAKEDSQASAPNGDTIQSLVDNLSQASLQESLSLVANGYIKRDTMTYLELNRAALQGLLERLDFGAMLLTKESREAQTRLRVSIGKTDRRTGIHPLRKLQEARNHRTGQSAGPLQ